LNSAILFRHILNSIPEVKEAAPAEVRVLLEGIETVAEVNLIGMLNDLENEWKVKVDSKKAKIWLQILSTLSQPQRSETILPPESLLESKEVKGLKEVILGRVKSELANKIREGRAFVIEDTGKMAEDIINEFTSQGLALDTVGITKDEIKKMLDELKADN
jgi:hypothetical protein